MVTIVKWQDYFAEKPPVDDDWHDFASEVASGVEWDELLLGMRKQFIFWMSSVVIVHELLDYAMQCYWEDEMTNELIREYWASR